MYAQHVPLIRAHALASPSGLADVLAFVVVTIRVPFGRVPQQMRELKQSGESASCLWGNKRAAYRAIVENHKALHAALTVLDYTGDALGNPGWVACEAIDEIVCAVPGLNIVKAAFVAQMLGHNVACFDSRNLEVLGYDTGTQPFKANLQRGPDGRPTLKRETRLRRIGDYVEATRESGGSEYWWDYWCGGIAPALGIDANQVSQWHWDCVRKGSGIK